MHRQRLSRAPLAAALAVAAVLLVPAVAQAHHVDSTAECVLVDGQPTLKLTADFVSFSSTKEVSGRITVDGVVKFDGAVPVVWNGDNGSWVWTQPAVAGKSYAVATAWTWSSGSDGEDHTTQPCPGPPPAPSVPVPTTPPTGNPPTGASPAVTPPAVTPPAGGVLPETALSGRARLRGPSGCITRTFRARVIGRSIARVRFFVDGTLVKTVRGTRPLYTVRVQPRSYGFGRHRVTVRVRFVAASGTPARTLRLTFSRCRQQVIAPRFTG